MHGASFAGGILLEEELGRGAHSVVYRARREGQAYAVKLSQETDANALAEAKKRFRREAVLLARARHPGLPTAIEVGEWEGKPYLVLELVEGKTLAEALLDGPMPEGRLIAFALAFADILDTIHQQGWIHRDVTPKNILIDSSGAPRLLDFGLATAAGHQRPEETVGTFAYSAPEQTGMLKRPLDGRADLYALGAVLFECATGRPPFTATDPAALLRQHALEPPPDPRSLAPELSLALGAILLKLLAKDPDDRYPTAASLAHDLLRLEALEEQLQSGREVVLGAHRSEPIRSRSRFVGREEELTRLSRTFGDVSRGHGQALLIEGEPGAGKSRLVQQFLQRLEAEGAFVLSGKCSEDASAPLEPFRQALEQYLRRIDRLPPGERAAAVERIREAAGRSAFLLKRLSPRLAELLDDLPSARPNDSDEPFFHAVVDFLLHLARGSRGAVLHLDDVQWLDPASAQVVRVLALRLERAPLLLAATARRDAHPHGPASRFVEDLGPALKLRLGLGPLGTSALRGLLANELSAEALPPGLVEQIASRSQGNPLAAEEFLRAMLEEGLLRPHRGEWRFDREGLETLRLPGDVLRLIAQRVEALGPVPRQVLRAAAVIGLRFRTAPLPDVCERLAEEVEAALAEAEHHHLLEPAENGERLFVHDRVREALLSSLSAHELARLHQRVAEALARSSVRDPDHLYALARHYALGANPRQLPQLFEASFAAGRMALADYAYERAYLLLEQASRAAGSLKSEVPAEFREVLAEACQHTGRIPEAIHHLRAAIASASEPLRRVRLRTKLVEVLSQDVDNANAWEELEKCFGELGLSPPRGTVRQLLWAGLRWLAGLVMERFGLWLGSARGEQRIRHELLARLYEAGGQLAYYRNDPVLTAQTLLDAFFTAHLLGRSSELVTCYRNYAVLMSLLLRPRAMERYAQKAIRLADALGDLRGEAEARLYRAWALETCGTTLEAQQDAQRCLAEQGPWLGGPLILLAYAHQYWGLALRGRLLEARTWAQQLVEKGQQRNSAGSGTELVSQYALAWFQVALGNAREAMGRFRHAEDRRRQAGSVFPQTELLLAGYRLMYFVEQGELGEPLEETIQRFHALTQRPDLVPFGAWNFYVFQCHARLAQCQGAVARGERLELGPLSAALRELTQIRSRPILRPNVLFFRAAMARLRGEVDRALRLLDQAERAASEVDAPGVLMEVARERARIFVGRGQSGAARSHAQIAQLLAEEHGFKRRARAIASEFGLTHSTASSDHRQTADMHSVHVERYLEALLQVGEASASIFDTDRVVEVALEKIVELLGAERAFFFLYDEAEDRLELKAHRGGRGTISSDEYSRSVVDQVRETQQAVILGATNGSERLGSDSAVAYGLRSVIAVPLSMQGRLLGVVYLDNRLAKGVFTEEDVGILMALANHIAIALENARAATLEIGIQAAQQRQQLSEALRSLTNAMLSASALEEKLELFLSGVTEVISCRYAVALIAHDGRFEVLAERGDGLPAGSTPEHPALAEMLSTLEQRRRPVQGSWTFGPGEADRILGVPLDAGESLVGAVLLARRSTEGFSVQETHLAATFAGQAAIVIENARLFEEVHRLATVDELTGAKTRRHFFVVAEHTWARRRRSGEPLVALMIDVDHFKRVNDTYGHAVGDQVLKEIGSRLNRCIREMDVLGRYGGEEFVLLLPDQPLAVGEAVAERVRRAIEREPIDTRAGPLQVTISVGLAEAGADTPDLALLLSRADAALYEAKRKGRNQVELARTG